ncbi:MAG: YfcE family phosphodiesterase [Clostridia bacterium]|nr:YfcE family phosphodiesterase [Clostridia bacterium]
MSYLIFSDSHGTYKSMKAVIDRTPDKIDGVIFLGDVYSDIENIEEAYPLLSVYAVAGNCDFGLKFLSPIYQERMIDIDGVRVLILHGHMQSVKSGTIELEAYARRKDADVVLYGHTHERDNRYIGSGKKPLYVFNPGSVSRPRDGEPSFGVLTVKNGQVLLSHGNVYIR